MNIIYVCEIDINKDSAEKIHVTEVVKNFNLLGHKAFLIAPRITKPTSGTKNIKFVPTINILFLRSIIYSILLFIHLPWYIYLKKPKFIYVRYAGLLLAPLLISKIFKIPYVSELNGVIPEEAKSKNRSKLWVNILNFTYRVSSKFSNIIIVVTPGIKKYLINKFNISSEKIYVVSNGANTDLFKPLNISKSILGLDNNTKYICFQGNIAPWQGIDYLIKAANKIIQQYSNYKFLIVGDGSERLSLEKLVKEMKLSNYFIFTGKVSYEKVSQYINASEFCLAPFSGKNDSDSALGSPLKIYEYLACKKPVLASDIDGVNNIPNFENFILTFKPRSVDDLAKKILLLINNKKISDQMANIGYETVLRNYSWKSTARKIINIYYNSK